MESGRRADMQTEMDPKRVLEDVLHGRSAVREPVKWAPDRVRDAMTGAPDTLGPSQPVAVALMMLADKPVHHIPVVRRDGTIVGMVSDRDVLSFLAKHGDVVDAPISAVMTAKPRTIQDDAPLSEAVKVMVHYGIHSLVVVDADGQLVGILTTTDLMRILAALQGWVERHRP